MTRSQSTEEERRSADEAEDASQEPYNAANPDHVARRSKDSRSKLELQRAGLRDIMGSRQGRAWMAHLLNGKLFTRIGSALPSDPMTGNSMTYYNLALRRVGEVMSAELAEFCPADFRRMEDEFNGR